MKEYLIYCDESDSCGKYYANFYGGLVVSSTRLKVVVEALESKKRDLNLEKELKWQRVTSNYLDKYIEFIGVVFDLIDSGDIKIRIMFTQNVNVVRNHDRYHRENQYFLLYYQFIKHAFGLKYAGPSQIRLYLDKLPDTKEKCLRFKGHLISLNQSADFRKANVKFDKNQIAEIDSSKHVLAQALDVVLGAIQFRLNDKHLEKPAGSYRRGKRTVAKEKLYKHINHRIRGIYSGFNIGVSTSIQGNAENRWVHPYRHWLFTPKGAVYDETKVKGKRQK